VPGLNPGKYISIYPNPSAGVFLVNLNFPPDDNGNQVQTESVTITDVLGRQVATINNEALNSNSFKVDLSGRQSGVYFLNIVAGDQKVVKRIEKL
jgi:hypothetical protein